MRHRGSHSMSEARNHRIIGNDNIMTGNDKIRSRKTKVFKIYKYNVTIVLHFNFTVRLKFTQHVYCSSLYDSNRNRNKNQVNYSKKYILFMKKLLMYKF